MTIQMIKFIFKNRCYKTLVRKERAYKQGYSGRYKKKILNIANSTVSVRLLALECTHTSILVPLVLPKKRA